jgi:hypothetical protein
MLPVANLVTPSTKIPTLGSSSVCSQLVVAAATMMFRLKNLDQIWRYFDQLCSVWYTGQHKNRLTTVHGLFDIFKSGVKLAHVLGERVDILLEVIKDSLVLRFLRMRLVR